MNVTAANISSSTAEQLAEMVLTGKASFVQVADVLFSTPIKNEAFVSKMLEFFSDLSHIDEVINGRENRKKMFAFIKAYPDLNTIEYARLIYNYLSFENPTGVDKTILSGMSKRIGTTASCAIFMSPLTPIDIVANYRFVEKPKDAGDERQKLTLIKGVLWLSHQGIQFANAAACDLLISADQGVLLRELIDPDKGVSPWIVTSIISYPESGIQNKPTSRNFLRSTRQRFLSEGLAPEAQQVILSNPETLTNFVKYYLDIIDAAVKNSVCPECGAAEISTHHSSGGLVCQICGTQFLSGVTPKSTPDNMMKAKFTRSLFVEFFKNGRVKAGDKVEVLRKIVLDPKFNVLYDKDLVVLANVFSITNNPALYAAIIDVMRSDRIGQDECAYVCNVLTKNKDLASQWMKPLWDIMVAKGIINHPLAINAENSEWKDEAEKKFGTNIATKEEHYLDTSLLMDNSFGGIDTSTNNWYGMHKLSMLEKESGVAWDFTKRFLFINALMLAIDMSAFALLPANVKADIKNSPQLVDLANRLVSKQKAGDTSPSEEQAIDTAKRHLESLRSSSAFQTTSPAPSEVQTKPASPPAATVTNTPAKAPAKTPAAYSSCDIGSKEVAAIKAVEGSKTTDISYAGAAGVMQLMPATWKEINEKHFAGKFSWSKYRFNERINLLFGKRYLTDLKLRLDQHKTQWRANEFYLVAASYNAGLARIKRCRFDADIIKSKFPGVHDYAERACNLAGHKVK